MKQSVPMRVTGLWQYLKGILKFSGLHEEKVVKEEKNGLDTHLKNDGNFLLKLLRDDCY